jgi:hypothetical protein
MHRAFVVAFILGPLMMACGSVNPAVLPEPLPAERRAGAEVVYLHKGNSLTVLDGATGQTRAERPWGVPSPDWKQLYTVSEGPVIRVQALDIISGRVLRESTLDGPFQSPSLDVSGALGGLSRNGATLVLEGRRAPSGPATTRFAVLDTSFERPPQYIDLAGWFEFDALSPDGRSLYLIEHLPPPADAVAYRVRLFDVPSGKLRPEPLVEKGKFPTEPMYGWRGAQLASPNDGWVYTFYANHAHGFIHALDTASGGVICIDLPHDWAMAGASWGLAASPDGRRLYAANSDLGVAAVVQDFQVKQQARLPESSAGVFDAPVAEAKEVRAGAAVSPDGRVLYAIDRKGIAVINAGNLQYIKRYLPDRRLSSLALSPDGTTLYALDETGRRLTRLEARSGAVFNEQQVDPLAQAIVRVADETPSTMGR